MTDGDLRCLLFETSGRIGRVGVSRGGNLLAERALDPTRRHGRDLAPAVDWLLRENRWHARDVDALMISLGPGSYTGLRVGAMSAKAFAFATGCALVGVPTFEAIGLEVELAVEEIDVVVDAQQSKLYAQRFGRTDRAKPFRPAAPLMVVDGRQWASERTASVPVVGPGVPVAAAWLPSQTPAVTAVPSLAGVLAAGAEAWIRGRRDEPVLLEPIYFRPSSAEEQWARREAGAAG